MTKLRLQDRVALVTGGGTGIGSAVAKLFAEEGAKVIVSGRRAEPLKGTVDEIVSKGNQASYIVGDVGKISDAKEMIEYTIQQYGWIDTLVNSAGVINRVEKVEETTDKQWDWQMDTNLRGIFHTIKCSLPYMKERKKGAIVNIGSVSASLASSGYATYCATKGGVVAYTRVIALQYAEVGIRANTVSPGMIHTPLSYVDRPNFDELVDGILERLYPIKRVGLPEDVAYAALYLASDDASWVTGQEIIVDGGFSIK